MNNTANKKDIFYVVVLLLTFITVIVGATFAIYTEVYKDEEKVKAVYTGSLSIEYRSGKIISPEDLSPTEEPTIDTEENVYKNKFRVTNTGSLRGKITIRININKSVEHPFERDEHFDKIPLKYSLYSGKDVVSSGFLIEKKDDVESIIASNIVLDPETTIDYTLLIWIAENGKDQTYNKNKEFLGTIQVDAVQNIE